MSLINSAQNLPEAVSEGLNSCVDLHFSPQSEMTRTVTRRVLDYLIQEAGSLDAEGLSPQDFVRLIYLKAVPNE